MIVAVFITLMTAMLAEIYGSNDRETWIDEYSILYSLTAINIYLKFNIDTVPFQAIKTIYFTLLFTLLLQSDYPLCLPLFNRTVPKILLINFLCNISQRISLFLSLLLSLCPQWYWVIG